jgi:hypothetical protein
MGDVQDFLNAENNGEADRHQKKVGRVDQAIDKDDQ